MSKDYYAIERTEKSSGRRYHGEVKTAWYHKAYSFDRGNGWHRSINAAFLDAKRHNALWEVSTAAAQKEL